MEERILKIKETLTALDGKKYEKNSILCGLERLKAQMYAALPERVDREGDATTKSMLKYFEERNARLNHVADAQLKKFAGLSAEFNEALLVEKSGRKGEKMALKSLETASKVCRIFKNVELERDGHTAEIDLIAFTSRAVFLIEVKNTARNVTITQKGDFLRENGDDVVCFKRNIGIQMNEKEHVLRSVFKQGGIDNINIQSLVVFANSKIEVDNQSPYIKTCFLSELPHIIDEYEGVVQYRPQLLNRFTEIIFDARKHIKWYLPMDIPAFKDAFARLLVTLEVAEERKVRRENSFFGRLCSFFERLFGKRTKVATPC